jgi:hypothetical protein
MTIGAAAHFSFSRFLLAGTIGGLTLTFASAAIGGPSAKGNDRPAFSVRDVQTDRDDNDEGNGRASRPNPHSLAQLRSNSTGPKMETSVDRRTTTPAKGPKGVDLSNMSVEDAMVYMMMLTSQTARDDMKSQLKQMEKNRQRRSKRPP